MSDVAPEVGPAEARRLVDEGAMLLDVREPDEWEAGRATGADWIQLGTLVARRDELPRDRRIVVVCRSGSRSAEATKALNAWGHDAVSLAGGMRAWAADGLPVLAADGRPGQVA